MTGWHRNYIRVCDIYLISDHAYVLCLKLALKTASDTGHTQLSLQAGHQLNQSGSMDVR